MLLVIESSQPAFQRNLGSWERSEELNALVFIREDSQRPTIVRLPGLNSLANFSIGKRQDRKIMFSGRR